MLPESIGLLLGAFNLYDIILYYFNNSMRWASFNAVL